MSGSRSKWIREISRRMRAVHVHKTATRYRLMKRLYVPGMRAADLTEAFRTEMIRIGAVRN